MVARISPPGQGDWDTSRLSNDRRAHLDSDRSFEEIARAFDDATIVRATVKSYKNPPSHPKEARQARQIIFLVRAVTKACEACDLLYNAPDGLRGRYWQSSDHGFEATRYLIRKLLPALRSFAEANPPTLLCGATMMSVEDMLASLNAPSAKVWPREFDDDHKWLFADQPLVVSRWQKNAPTGMWRQTPIGADLEIKGALLGLDGTEYVPEGKRTRSCQIHCTGFT